MNSGGNLRLPTVTVWQELFQSWMTLRSSRDQSDSHSKLAANGFVTISPWDAKKHGILHRTLNEHRSTSPGCVNEDTERGPCRHGTGPRGKSGRAIVGGLRTSGLIRSETHVRFPRVSTVAETRERSGVVRGKRDLAECLLLETRRWWITDSVKLKN